MVCSLTAQRNQSVMVIGSTLEMKNLDPSILRPGRLEEHIAFSVPTPAMRKEILISMLRDIPLEVEEERDQLIEWLCLRTSGKTVAEIKGAIVKAVFLSLKHGSVVAVSKQNLIDSLDGRD